MAVPQELATLWHTSTCTSFSARLVLRVRVFRRSCSTDMQDTRIRVRAYRRVAHFVSFLRVSGTLPSRSLARRVFESSSSDHVQCDPGDPCDRHVVLYRREWSSFVDGSTKRFRECRSRGPLASLRIDRPCGTIGSHGAGTGVPTNGWPGMTRARLVDWTGFVTHRTRGRMVGMKCRVVGWTCQRIVASFVSTPVLRTTGWVRGWRTIEPWHGRSSVSPRVLPAFGATPSCPSSFPRIHPSIRPFCPGMRVSSMDHDPVPNGWHDALSRLVHPFAPDGPSPHPPRSLPVPCAGGPCASWCPRVPLGMGPSSASPPRVEMRWLGWME